MRNTGWTLVNIAQILVNFFKVVTLRRKALFWYSVWFLAFSINYWTAYLLTVVSNRTDRTIIDLGLLKLWYLIGRRLWKGYDMLVFFTNWSLMKFQFGCLVLFCLFWIIGGGFRLFSMRSLSKNTYPVNLDFFKSQFLILHFSYCRSMTFFLNLFYNHAENTS